MKQLLLTSCCLVAATTVSLAQAGRNNFPTIRSQDSVKAAEETARLLREARAAGQEQIQRNDAQRPDMQRVTELAEKVRRNPPGKPSFAERKQAEESDARMRGAMSRLAPEGKMLLAQSSSAPAMRAPDEVPVASPAVKASPLTSDTPGPKPTPLKPTPITDPTKVPAQTVINAGTSFFDSRAGFGVFVDSVVVDHPQFHLVCDELQVYMNKEAEAGEGTPPAAGASSTTTRPATAGELAASGAAEKEATPGDNDPATRSNGSLKRAIAKGRKVVINKMSDKGEPQTGIGREADYDGKTGDIILRGWPQIQEGQNLTEATEPTTYFLIKANGQFQALNGRARTRIIQADEKKGGARAAGVTPPVAVPVPGAAPAPVLNTRTPGVQ